MKIWLDDYRAAPDGWERAEDYNYFTYLYEKNKDRVEKISLDYDLSGIRNGFDVCKFLASKNYWPREIRVHSNHEYGVPKMLSFLRENAPKETIIIDNSGLNLEDKGLSL